MTSANTIPEPLRALIPGYATRVILPELVSLAEREGILECIRAISPFTFEGLCATLSLDLDFDLTRGNRRRMVRLLVELLSEVRWLRRIDDERWRCHGSKKVVPEIGERGEEDGEIRFLRSCLQGTPAYLRGDEPPITFESGCAAAWEDFLGCAEFQACRTVLFDMMASGSAPETRLLDLCHGPGWGIERALDRWPAARISAIDFTDGFAETARSRTARAIGRNASLGLASAPVQWYGPSNWKGFDAPLPFADESFDAVLFGCGDPYIPPGRREPVYADLRRVLAPGGVLEILTRGLPDAERRHVPSRTFRVTTLIHDFAESVCAGWQGFSDVGENLRLFERIGFRDAGPSSGEVAFFGSSLWFMRKGGCG